MNQHEVIHNSAHPSSAELDRLRAGLLDDQPAQRTALVAHLENCPECRRHSQLAQRVGATLDAQVERNLPGLLLARRQRALRGQPVERRRRLVPALAVAVVTVIAVGIGVMLRAGPDSSDTVPVVAHTDADDLYVDIDFYLWLIENKPSQDDASPSG